MKTLIASALVLISSVVHAQGDVDYAKLDPIFNPTTLGALQLTADQKSRLLPRLESALVGFNQGVRAAQARLGRIDDDMRRKVAERQETTAVFKGLYEALDAAVDAVLDDRQSIVYSGFAIGPALKNYGWKCFKDERVRRRMGMTPAQTAGFAKALAETQRTEARNVVQPDEEPAKMQNVLETNAKMTDQIISDFLRRTLTERQRLILDIAQRVNEAGGKP